MTTARISRETLRGWPASVTCDSCLRLKSQAGRPAGVYLTAPRSTRCDDRTTRFMRPQPNGASGTSGRSLLLLLLRRFASVFLFHRLHHHGGAGFGLALDDSQVAQHGVVEAETRLQLGQHFL